LAAAVVLVGERASSPSGGNVARNSPITYASDRDWRGRSCRSNNPNLAPDEWVGGRRHIASLLVRRTRATSFATCDTNTSSLATATQMRQPSSPAAVAPPHASRAACLSVLHLTDSMRHTRRRQRSRLRYHFAAGAYLLVREVCRHITDVGRSLKESANFDVIPGSKAGGSITHQCLPVWCLSRYRTALS